MFGHTVVLKSQPGCEPVLDHGDMLPEAHLGSVDGPHPHPHAGAADGLSEAKR